MTEKGIEDHLRLSCQMRVHKDIVVRPVLTVENSGLDADHARRSKSMNLKQLAGEYAATFVKDGMKIGLGTGSTVYWMIEKLGERVKEGLSFQAVPTSKETEVLAQQLNIPLISLNDIQSLDLTIDGADEIDSNYTL